MPVDTHPHGNKDHLKTVRAIRARAQRTSRRIDTLAVTRRRQLADARSRRAAR